MHAQGDKNVPSPDLQIVLDKELARVDAPGKTTLLTIFWMDRVRKYIAAHVGQMDPGYL